MSAVLEELRGRVATPEEVEEARAWVRALTEEQGVPKQRLAEHLGVSRSAVSLFVAGKQPSPSLAVRALELKRRVEAEKAATEEAAAATDNAPRPQAEPEPFRLGFILTQDAERVLTVCRICAQQQRIGLITGHAGAGKTTALREYLREDPRAVMITADVLMTAKSLVEDLAGALGVDQYGPVRMVMQRVLERLAEEPRLVIVDEADLLITHTTRKMEILRALHDQAGAGVVLCGLKRLQQLLVKGPTMRENLAQLYSRVWYRAELKGLSKAEAMDILGRFPVTEAAKRALVGVAEDHDRGGIRRLVAMLERCMAIARANGSEVTESVVQAAASLLVF